MSAVLSIANRQETEAASASICLVAQNSYPALIGGGIKHRAIGGVQHQTALTAKWLVGAGYPTSMITWDEGYRDGDTVAGVRLRRMCRANAGVAGVRFLYPRAYSLMAAMRRADADLYYHNTAEHETGLVAIWCRLKRKKFVYSVAHDNGCGPDLPLMKGIHERILYRYGLRNATCIIVQTQRQQDMLRKTYGLSSTVVPMPCPGPAKGRYIVPPPPEKPRFVWVGRAAPIKRMEVLFDVAEKMVDVQFDIAAANPETQYGGRLQERAQALKNVRWLGPVRREEMPALYEGATGLCCTSVSEGFPNTFLEAWSHGRPLVSSFDPDGLIRRFRLGFSVNTIDDFVAGLRALAFERGTWNEMSANGRLYYEANHAIDVSMKQFQCVLDQALASEPASRRGGSK